MRAIFYHEMIFFFSNKPQKWRCNCHGTDHKLSYAHSWESGIRADEVGRRHSISFVYSKCKPASYWFILKSYSIFFTNSYTSNSRLVFFFAFSSVLPCSSLLTRAHATTTFYIIHWNASVVNDKVIRCDHSEPILPIRRIRKLRRAPKHQGASLLSRMI